MKPKVTSRRGYSLISILLAVVIMGILTALTMPAIRGLKDLATDQEAVGRAAALNQAQQAYKWRVGNAVSQWSTAPAAEDKFQLIRDYLPLKDTFSTLIAFQPNGYAFTLGGTLDTQVAITGPRGPVSY